VRRIFTFNRVPRGARDAGDAGWHTHQMTQRINRVRGLIEQNAAAFAAPGPAPICIAIILRRTQHRFKAQCTDDGTEGAIRNQFARAFDGWTKAALIAYTKQTICFFCRRDHFLCVGNRIRHGFFNEDVRTHRKTIEGDRGVGRMRCCDDSHIRFVFGEHRAVIGVEGTIHFLCP
jgi:hypothetical protein